MTRVGLVCSEPIAPRMGGIGVRYVEMTRRLAAAGFDVRLVSPSPPEVAAEAGLDRARVGQYDHTRHERSWSDRDVVVAQGQLANDLVLGGFDGPLVVDFYDPWLVENLAYAEPLGLAPYRNDHRSWILQLGRADLVLCASEEQRLFYLGFLAALGRLNPRRLEIDPELSDLIAVVPFGCTPLEVLPPFAPPSTPRLLFGGLYDWYDVDTLVGALERLRTPNWCLSVVRGANPESTPQRQLSRLEAASRERAWWGDRVVLIDRVPASRHDELVTACDLLVAPHRATFEAELSFRTRFLDALAAGCPVIATKSGSLSRQIELREAGWVVPPGDSAALAAAIDEVLAGGEAVERRRRHGRDLAAEFDWSRAMAPLVRFLRAPRVDPTRDAFVYRPETVTPREGALGRLWRRARRRAARGAP